MHQMFGSNKAEFMFLKRKSLLLLCYIKYRQKERVLKPFDRNTLKVKLGSFNLPINKGTFSNLVLKTHPDHLQI